LTSEPKDCRWPWNRLYVHVDGSIKPCCYALFSVGNIATQTDLDKVWHGKTMEGLRTSIQNNKIHPICAGAGCSYVKSQIPDEIMVSSKKFRDTIPTDLVEATIHKLALLGYREAAYSVAISYHNNKNDRIRALLWFERAAKTGQVNAIYFLGYAYRYMYFRKLLRWRGVMYLKKAVELQYPEAFSALGLHRHLAKNYGEAHRLFRRGAELNDPAALFWMYQYSLGGFAVEKNADKARHFLKLSARRGHAPAQEILDFEMAASKAGKSALSG
jgi:tetratricopeptide (TPR) repeat protein